MNEPQNGERRSDRGEGQNLWGYNPIGAAWIGLSLVAALIIVVVVMKEATESGTTAAPSPRVEAVPLDPSTLPSRADKTQGSLPATVAQFLAEQERLAGITRQSMETAKSVGSGLFYVAALQVRCEELDDVIVRLKSAPYPETDKRRAIDVLKKEQAWACDTAEAIKRDVRNKY